MSNDCTHCDGLLSLQRRTLIQCGAFDTLIDHAIELERQADRKPSEARA